MLSTLVELLQGSMACLLSGVSGAQGLCIVFAIRAGVWVRGGGEDLSVQPRSSQVRIDHKNGTVHFGGLSLESERLRDNISLLARRLAKAATMMDAAPPPDRAAAKAKVPPPAPL